MPNELPSKLKIATVWLLVLLVLFLAVQAWQRHQEESRFTSAGGVIEIQRSMDGHYHWPGTLNGQRIDFLVDTGATASSIPMAMAVNLALPIVGTMRSDTANGVVAGKIVMADLTLRGGVTVERMRISALPALASPLLGMDVLSRLRLQQSAGVLRIDLSGQAI